MNGYKRDVPLAGEALHRRAEQIIGKHEYNDVEYMAALERAEAEARTAESVDELAAQIRREQPELSEDAARVWARCKLGEFATPDDRVQAAAEQIARQRGTSIEKITDYGELAALYEAAERTVR